MAKEPFTPAERAERAKLFAAVSALVCSGHVSEATFNEALGLNRTTLYNFRNSAGLSHDNFLALKRQFTPAVLAVHADKPLPAHLMTILLGVLPSDDYPDLHAGFADAGSASDAGDLRAASRIPDSRLAQWMRADRNLVGLAEARYSGLWWIIRPSRAPRGVTSGENWWNLSLLDMFRRGQGHTAEADDLPKFELRYRTGPSPRQPLDLQSPSTVWEYQGRVIPIDAFVFFIGVRMVDDRFPLLMRWQKSIQSETGRAHETTVLGQVAGYNSSRDAISATLVASHIPLAQDALFQAEIESRDPFLGAHSESNLLALTEELPSCRQLLEQLQGERRHLLHLPYIA